MTNTFDAEYGRNSGSVVNVVTKSGTNEIHGDFYEFLRNNFFEHARYFDPTCRITIRTSLALLWAGRSRKISRSCSGRTKGTGEFRARASVVVQLPSADEAAGNFGGPGAFTGTLHPTFATNWRTDDWNERTDLPAGGYGAGGSGLLVERRSRGRIFFPREWFRRNVSIQRRWRSTTNMWRRLERGRSAGAERSGVREISPPCDSTKS